MESLNVIKKEEAILIKIRSDFDTGEELLLADFKDNIDKGNVYFKVIECLRNFGGLKLDSIPVLLLSKSPIDFNFDSFNENIKETIFNNIRGNAPIPLASNDNILSKYIIKPISNNDYFTHLEDINIDFSDKIITEKSLLNVFSIGDDVLFIVPNHSFMYFEEDELKKTIDGFSLKKTLLKKNSFRENLRKRKKELRNYTYDLIRSIGNSYNEDNLKSDINRDILNYSFNIKFSKEN